MFQARCGLVVLFLGVVGCGPKPMATTQKVHAIVALTGTRADVGRGNAMQVAINDLNAAGGVGGQQLELVLHDSESNESRASEIGIALKDEGAQFLFTGSSDTSIPVITNVTIPSKVFVFATGTSSPSLTTMLAPQAGGYFVRTSPASDVAAKQLANLAYADGVRTIGLVYSDDSFGRTYQSDFAAEFTRLGGALTGSPAAAQSIASGTVQASYLTQLQNAANGATVQGGKTAVAVITGPAVFKVLLRDAATNNLNIQWYGAHTNRDATVLTDFPQAAEGMKGFSPQRGTDVAYNKYAESVAAAYPTMDPAGTWYPHIYDAVIVFGLAAAKGGVTADALKANVRAVANAGAGRTAVDPSNLREGLSGAAAGDLDYQGASGPLEFDANGDIAGGYREFRVTGGAFVDVP